MEAEQVDNGNYIRFTAGSDLDAGQVVGWGTGIAVVDVATASGRVANAAIEGTYEFTKPTGVGTDRALGELVGFDITDKEIVDVSGADLFCGRVTEAATTTDTVVKVKINAPAPESLA